MPTPEPSDAAMTPGGRASARVGSVVDGKWTLDAVLGTGGMASVFAATHRNGTRAAVKILHPEIALNPSAKTRFLREGYVANKIGHAGAVTILDDDEAPDGTVYLVMELLDGEALQEKVDRGKRMPVRDVLRVADAVLEVLEVAHAKDVIHRDLKPGNLLVTNDGAVKVLDFGIAKLRETTHPTAPHVTTVSAMGTPGFMPPEQARGRWDDVDARADIWAVGATMFTLLSGRYVHESETVQEQLLAAMTKPAPPLREVLADAPENVAALVDCALAFERDARWPSAAAMRSAVRAARDDIDAIGAAQTLPESAPPRSSARPHTSGDAVKDVEPTPSRRRSIAVAVAALAAVAIFAAVRFSSQSPGEAVGAPSSAPIATSAPIAPIATSAMTITAPASATPAAAPIATGSVVSAPVASVPPVAPRPPLASTKSITPAPAPTRSAAPVPAPRPSASAHPVDPLDGQR